MMHNKGVGAMRYFRKPALLLATGLAFTAVFFFLGLFGRISPALAHGSDRVVNEGGRLAQAYQAPAPRIFVGVVFTDPAIIPVLDLAGNDIGDGMHTGVLRCRNDNCNRKIQLVLTDPTTGLLSEYEYQFRSAQTIDPEAERVVVAGTGTRLVDSQRERFLFTATFENNRDGTVKVTSIASRPDASFLIPASPGTFRIEIRNALKNFSEY
jgi:hypothetical protein